MTQPAAIPDCEQARLDVLQSLGILDTEAEESFDELTLLAAQVCNVPIALVSLIDSNRQWFKSRVGIEASETCRDKAFCAHAILEDGVMVVEDAWLDPRFRENPLVTGPPWIRFYAGAPLCTPDGFKMGTLCVIDRVARTLSDEQKTSLAILSRQVVSQLLFHQTLSNLACRVVESESFRVLAEHSSDAHLLVHERQGLIDCNPATLRLYGCQSKEELLSIHPATFAPEYQPDGQASADKRIVMDQLARKKGFQRFEWTARNVHGKEIPCEVTLQSVMLNDRSLLLAVVHDLTERKQTEDKLFTYKQKLEEAYAKLKENSITDQLTSLLNRKAFDERLCEEFDRAKRFKRLISVAMLDVDYFKQYNDVFGHLEGDKVLTRVGKLLKDTIRTIDVLARFGGEEFVLILPDTDASGAMVVAERCRRAIAGHAWERRPVTLSIGVATTTDLYFEPEAMIKEADIALYEAKAQGRNRVNHRAGKDWANIPLVV